MDFDCPTAPGNTLAVPFASVMTSARTSAKTRDVLAANADTRDAANIPLR